MLLLVLLAFCDVFLNFWVRQASHLSFCALLVHQAPISFFCFLFVAIWARRTSKSGGRGHISSSPDVSDGYIFDANTGTTTGLFLIESHHILKHSTAFR
jgi:hypothetical protein